MKLGSLRASLVGVGAAAAAALREPQFARVEETLEGLVASANIQGGSLLVDVRGERFTHSVGNDLYGDGDDINLDSLYRMYSMTKTGRFSSPLFVLACRENGWPL